MLLYTCRVCGRWQDVSITQVLQKALEPLNKWAAEQQGMSYQPQQEWACPAGHGLMTQVMPTDRIFVRVPLPTETPDRK